jgi:hypothetical protein
MSKRFLRQADNCRGRGPLNPFLVRLMCGRISSNGKSLRKPAGLLAGNFFVKAGKFFIKKAPASSRRGPTRKETYTPPPKSSVPSPVECESIVFHRFLQIVDKQDY